MLLSGGLNEAGEEVFSSDVIFETRAPVNAYSSNPDNLYRPPLYINFALFSSTNHISMVNYRFIAKKLFGTAISDVFVVYQSVTNTGHPTGWVLDQDPTGIDTLEQTLEHTRQ